jgi:hypothetical protein
MICALSTSPATSGALISSAATAWMPVMSWPVSQRSWSNSWTPMSMAIPPECARKAAAGGDSSHW